MLSVVWSVLGVLWVLSAPGFLIGYAAMGDPPRGFLPGWGISFLGWLSFPVTVVVALVLQGADGPWHLLPLVSVVVVPAGFGIAVLGARVVERFFPAPPRPAPPPRPAAPTAPRVSPQPWPREEPGPEFAHIGDHQLLTRQLDVVQAAVDLWLTDASCGVDPAIPLLVLDVVRNGRDGEPVRRALRDLGDLTTGRVVLDPLPRQQALRAVLLLARLYVVDDPSGPRNDAEHRRLIQIALQAQRQG